MLKNNKPGKLQFDQALRYIIQAEIFGLYDLLGKNSLPSVGCKPYDYFLKNASRKWAATGITVKQKDFFVFFFFPSIL